MWNLPPRKSIRAILVDVGPTAEDIIELFIDVAGGNADEAQEEVVDVEPTAEDIELLIDDAARANDGETQEEVLDVEAPA